MRAIIPGPTGLELHDIPIPTPTPTQALIRVQAAGLNRAELAMASGHRHGSKGGAGNAIGLEWSGTIQSIGANVENLTPGQRVMATGAGSYAEFAVAEQGQILSIPPNMTFEEAAALPIALRAMHNAIVTLGHLAPGQSILIQGASAGVGLMALQIARHLGAATIIGTSGNPTRRARLPEYGATVALDATAKDWPKQILDATNGKGVDLAIDLVSGPAINDVLRATRLTGRVINNGRLGGNNTPFDFDLHATRRITYIGSSFRTRTPEEIRAINAAMRQDLWPALTAGHLRLPLDSTYPLDQAQAAQARMAANQHFGKIILKT